jgi:hypothetical protein
MPSKSRIDHRLFYIHKQLAGCVLDVQEYDQNVTQFEIKLTWYHSQWSEAITSHISGREESTKTRQRAVSSGPLYSLCKIAVKWLNNVHSND